MAVSAEHEGQSTTGATPSVTAVAGGGSGVHIGDRVGDTIRIGGDVSGSAVGSGAVPWARDVTTFNRAVAESVTLGAELRQKLTQARDIIASDAPSPSAKGDAADALGKLVDELKQPVGDAGRLKRLRDTIKGSHPLPRPSLPLRSSRPRCSGRAADCLSGDRYTACLRMTRSIRRAGLVSQTSFERAADTRYVGRMLLDLGRRPDGEG